MSEIEKSSGTSNRATGNIGKAELTYEIHEPDLVADHVSQFDPDLGHDERWDQYFTWIALERAAPAPATRSSEQKIRLGWSLAIATVANLVLGATAIMTGATLVGVVACTALSISTCLLVLAEIACRYGFDPAGRIRHEPGAHYLDDR